MPGYTTPPPDGGSKFAYALRRQAREGGHRLRLLRTLLRVVPAELRRFQFPGAAERALDPFCGEAPLQQEHYEDLFRYFAEGWCHYRTPTGAAAAYPGMPSWSGREVDRLEGFSRIMPLFAAWHISGRDRDVELFSGQRIAVDREFARGLRAGTDPGSPAYWGDIPTTSNQRTVEAADIALALWLFRDPVWTDFPERVRDNVIRWLSMVEAAPGWDNNWHLFYVLIDRVLTALGHPGQIPSAPARGRRVHDFHCGDGWFRDGVEGEVDYYNAWGFHYALFWINQIDPQWDADFIRECQRSFLRSFKYLIGPAGLPMLGRSVCYRLAVPAPLVFGSQTHADLVSPGEARRALDCVWRYFLRRGAVRHGVVTQGYFASDARVLDSYSGPASSFWSLRSLVAALSVPPDLSVWRQATELLPVERGDYELQLEGPQWTVRGDRRTHTITIEVMNNAPEAAPGLERVPWTRRLHNLANHRVLRPNNHEAKYRRRFYRSDQPFCS